jgi:SP family general alpha glucoside:H+ symporter-like MFS transporter
MNKVTADAAHLENVKADLGSSDYGVITAEAQIHQDAEHTMSIREALRRYPKAIMWSVILSGAMYLHPLVRISART